MSVNRKTPKRKHVYIFVYMYMYVSFIIRKGLIHLDRRLTADCRPRSVATSISRSCTSGHIVKRAVGQPQPSVCGKVRGHLWEAALSSHRVHSVCTAGMRPRYLAWQKRLPLLIHLAALPDHFSLLR